MKLSHIVLIAGFLVVCMVLFGNAQRAMGDRLGRNVKPTAVGRQP